MPMRESSIVRSSLARFTVLSLGTLVVLGVGIVVESERIAEHEAVRDARLRSERLASYVVAPLVGEGLRRGDDEALAALDAAMGSRLQDRSLSHAVVWTADGDVLWADRRDLVGRRFPLHPEVRVLVAGDRLLSRSATLDEPEYEGIDPWEPAERPLLDVYVPGRGTDGEPFVLEAAYAPDRVDDETDAIFRELLPLGLGALLLFQVAVLPLAWTLARRVDRANLQRSEILDRSLASWHAERRRLAHDLHDGVIQDLSSASYVLPSVLTHLREGPEDPPHPDRPPAAGPAQARRVGEQVTEMLVRDLAALRSLVTDLFPADLTPHGLVAAITDLAGLSELHGLTVHVSVPAHLEMDPEVAGVAYRVVREGLRNVVRHSGGMSAGVTVRASDRMILVEVADDGVGPGASPVVATRAPGSSPGEHVGLRLLGGVVTDVGGTLVLEPGPAGGSVLRAQLPGVLRA